MSKDLERRYARLLRLYPADYRRARGGELLETLLESAEDGRRWPAPREAGALVLGALRAHAGRDRRQSQWHSWLAAFHAAALMLLVYDIAGRAAFMVIDFSHRAAPSIWSPTEQILHLAALAFGAFAVAAGVRGQYRIAIATASVAFLITLVVAWFMDGPPIFTGFWHFPLAIVLLVPLLRTGPPPAAGLLRYAPALPLLMVFTDHGLAQVFPDVAGILQFGLLLAICLGSLLWLAVDERLAMAFGLLLFEFLLNQAVYVVQDSIQSLAVATLTVPITSALPAVLLLTSGLVAQRRAKI